MQVAIFKRKQTIDDAYAYSLRLIEEAIDRLGDARDNLVRIQDEARALRDDEDKGDGDCPTNLHDP